MLRIQHVSFVYLQNHVVRSTTVLVMHAYTGVIQLRLQYKCWPTCMCINNDVVCTIVFRGAPRFCLCYWNRFCHLASTAACAYTCGPFWVKKKTIKMSVFGRKRIKNDCTAVLSTLVDSSMKKERIYVCTGG